MHVQLVGSRGSRTTVHRLVTAFAHTLRSPLMHFARTTRLVVVEQMNSSFCAVGVRARAGRGAPPPFYVLLFCLHTTFVR